MADRTTASTERAISFGPFRLLPAQQLLLEGETPVRLGSRAFDILIALVENAGELVGKTDLIARVWPNTFVDENTLRVHVAGLRKALGDGQPGRRYLANVPGRGYRFVAPVDLSNPESSPIGPAGMPSSHNLPLSKSRVVGRAGVIDALRDQVTRQRLVTIVGSGGIGKTTVALAVAEALLPAYPDGIRVLDLAPIEDPQFIPDALGTALGLTVHLGNAIPHLVEFLRDKRMLIVLDSCEHLVETAALFVEQLLAGAPAMHILVTSREPLRADGERVHRLLPLDLPAEIPRTAAEALAYPAVQLFVERAAASVDGFELTDADAPVVSEICHGLDGVALAIELAAARVDAFGIQQLAVLLNDRLRILKQGKRTAQPRHQSLVATLDWSYEFLPEAERLVLRRLSVFAGAFTLDSAVAVAGDGDPETMEMLANLVAKSLVSADIGGAAVRYRLLDMTRAYALQKLIDMNEFDEYARRHAQHQLAWLKEVGTETQTRNHADWLNEGGRRIDDLRAALTWAFSPSGDVAIAINLTTVSSVLWPALGPLGESLQYVERALAIRNRQSAMPAREEARLLRVLASALTQIRGPTATSRKYLGDALDIAERTDDSNGRVMALLGLATYSLYAGHYREAVEFAEKCRAIGEASGDQGYPVVSAIAAPALYCLGESGAAQLHIDGLLSQAPITQQPHFVGYRVGAQDVRSNLQWLHGFPDQAIRSVEMSIEEGANAGPLTNMNTLAQAACHIALSVGDLAAADRWIAMLLDPLTKNPLPIWDARARCFKGMLLIARGEAAGVVLLEGGLERLREANFAFLRTLPTAALAQGYSKMGEAAKAHATIDDAIVQANRNEEHWCMAELLRIKGEIIHAQGLPGGSRESESHFLRALDRARQHGFLSWELRAATSLAKLWRDEGRIAEAAELLSAVYNRFTEGFDTVDLRTARALLDELRGMVDRT